MGSKRAAAAVLACALWAHAAPASAQTSCDATNRFTLDWEAQTTKLNLGTATRTFTASNPAGQSVTVTMSFAGETTRYIDSGFGQTPNISEQNSGGLAAGEDTLFLAVDFNAHSATLAGASPANVAIVRFGFSTTVRDVNFTVLDVDYSANQFRDWVALTGSLAATTYTPAIATPYGSNNSTSPGQTAPGVVFVGPGTADGFSYPAEQAVGRGLSAFTDAFGNIRATYVQPVNQVELRYGNGPAATMSGNAGIQSISIHDITFCPMPALTVAKTSTLVATTGENRFAVPGSAIDYTLTVTNSGGSTIDMGGALTDILPPQLTFFNGDIDAGTAGTQNFVFTPGSSGLTLGSGNISYSNNAGASYAYTPAAGFDSAVDAVRFAPQGTMAANSSFTIRFRARVD